MLVKVPSISETLEASSDKAEPSAFLERPSSTTFKLFFKSVIELVLDSTLPSNTSTLLVKSVKAEEEALVSKACTVLSSLEEI